MAPNTVVIHVPTGRELDLTDVPDLGHPDRPGLLDELYHQRRSPRYRPGELQCPDCRENNPDCPEWMFLRRRDGLFHAVHHNPNLGDHEPESDTHKALKQRMVTAAERGGLSAVAESRPAHGRRRTDVVVTGGAHDLACEAQISYATARSVRERADRAHDDGLTPLWATLNGAVDWAGQVPWALLDRKPWQYYTTEAQLPVRSGIRTLRIEACGRTGQVCPDRRRGRRCTGKHGTWEPAQITHLDDLIVRAAHGEFVPYRTRGSRRANWFWVRPEDLARVREEQDHRRSLDVDQPDTTVPDGPAADDRALDRTCGYEPSYRIAGRAPRAPAAAVNEPVVVALAPQTVTAPRSDTAEKPLLNSPNADVASYRKTMINPGTAPLEQASEDLAAANLDAFLTAVAQRAALFEQVPIRHRVAHLQGTPVRDPGADRDGRFGWNLPLSDGRTVRLLMPGVPLTALRDDLTAQAPCLYINGTPWWWNDAIARVANEGFSRAGLGRHPPAVR